MNYFLIRILKRVESFNIGKIIFKMSEDKIIKNKINK